MPQPTAPEPVNVISLTRSSSTSTSPIAPAEPETTLIQPGGRPASSSSSARKSAESGVADAGFRTTGQPAASAGAILCATRLSGKLNGEIAPTIPIGSAQRERELPFAGGGGVHRHDLAGELARLDGRERVGRGRALRPRRAPPSAACPPRPRSVCAASSCALLEQLRASHRGSARARAPAAGRRSAALGRVERPARLGGAALRDARRRARPRTASAPRSSRRSRPRSPPISSRWSVDGRRHAATANARMPAVSAVRHRLRCVAWALATSSSSDRLWAFPTSHDLIFLWLGLGMAAFSASICASRAAARASTGRRSSRSSSSTTCCAASPTACSSTRARPRRSSVETALFGTPVPTVWLQQHLWHGAHHLHWWDYAAWFIYLTHFFARSSPRRCSGRSRTTASRRYATMVCVLALTGFATYVLYPAVPPWMAARTATSASRTG